MNENTIYVDITVRDKGTAAAVKKLGTDLEETGKKGTKAMNDVGKSTEFSMTKFKDMIITVGIYTVAFQALNGAVAGVAGTFKRGLTSIEDFNLTVAASAAYITSFSKQAAEGDLAGGFRSANEYAGALATKLESIDSLTIASGKDLQTMSESFIQHGVLLDVNNQKQVEGFTNIATALALVTAGQNKDIQMRQEINALMMGQIRATDRLPKLLQAIDPLLEQHLKQWKEEGTIIENVGRLLQGFAASTGNLGDLWTTVGSTMETIHNRILRGAMKPIFEDLIGMAKEWNASLQDAEGNLTPLAQKIQQDINDAYRTGKELIKEYGGEVGTMVGVLTAAKVAQYLFNAAVRANPYVVAAGAIAFLNEQLKAYDMNIGSLPAKYNAMTASIENVVDVMRGLKDPETGKALSEQEQNLRKIAELRNTITSEKTFYSKDEPARIASINEEIRKLEQANKDLNTVESESIELRRKSNSEASVSVVALTNSTAAFKDSWETKRDLTLSMSKEILDAEVKQYAEQDAAAKKAYEESKKIVHLKATDAFDGLEIQKKVLHESLKEEEDAYKKVEALLKAKEADTEQAYNKMAGLIKSSKKTEVEVWQDAIDTELDEFERLSDGSEKYTDAIAEYREIKNKELLDRIKRNEKESLTEMGRMWLDFGHDVHNNFESVLASGLKREFDSIGDAAKELTDRMYSDFLDLIAKLIVAWAEAQIFGTTTGISMGGGSSTGGLVNTGLGWLWNAASGGESAWSSTGTYATEADYFGNGAGAQASGGSGGGTGGVVGGLATSVAMSYLKEKAMEYAIKPAYNAAVEYFASTSTEKIAEVAAEKAAEEAAQMAATKAGETAATTAGSTALSGSVASAIPVIGWMCTAMSTLWNIWGGGKDTTSMETRLNMTGQDTAGLAESTGIIDGGGMQAATESFRVLDEQIGRFSQVSIDSASNLTVLGLEIREVGERGQEMTTGMAYTVETFNAATGTWENTRVNFDAMIAQMEDLAPATEAEVDAAAAQVAAMNNVSALTDELTFAYVQAQLGTDAFAQSVALAGGAFQNAAGSVISAAEMLNGISIGIDMSGYQSADYSAEGHNFANNPDAISTAATDATYYELNGHADGGVIDRLLVPSGDDGIFAAKLGEGVVDADTMKILSSSIRSGKFSESGNSSKDIAELKEVLISLGMTITDHLRKSEKIMAGWDRIGLPAARA